MVRKAFIIPALIGLLSIGPAHPASGSMEEKAVRATLTRLADAFAKKNLPDFQLCISPRFLEQNSEIPGRVQAFFDQYDNINFQYRIASVRVVDDIATVKLNWTKTMNNPMNNWRYRDVGKDVVMYFSAMKPFTLIGLEDNNIFGVSFLLQTRIVIPTIMATTKLEEARKEIELAERRLALKRTKEEQELRKREEIERKRKEKMAAIEARRQERAQARETILAQRLAEKAKLEAEAAVKRAEAEKAAQLAEAETAAKRTAEKAARVREQPPKPEQDVEDLHRPLAPEELAQIARLIKAASATFDDPHVSLDPKTEKQIESDIKVKTDAQAAEMLRLRRKRDAALDPPPPQLPEEEVKPVQIEPSLPADFTSWRKEQIEEIRALHKDTVIKQPAPTPFPPITPSAADTELARDIRAKTDSQAIQLLAEKQMRERVPEDKPTPEIREQTPRDEEAEKRKALEQAQREALKRSESLRKKIELAERREEIARIERRQPEQDVPAAIEPRIPEKQVEPEPTPVKKQLVLDDIATLKQIEKKAAMEAEIRKKADRDAEELILKKLIPETIAPEDPPAPEKPDVAQPPPKDAPEKDLPVLAEEAKRRALIKQAAEQAAAIHQDFGIRQDVTDITVAVAKPEPEPEAVQPTPPKEPEITPAVAIVPTMAFVRGGQQPNGPDYDFMMSQFEVTNEEFCRFLNDAKENPTHIRGRNMFFDEFGNVFMDSSFARNKKMFSMTNLDFGGQQNGIRYDNGRYSPVPGRENHPAVGMSWYGALKYCNWLTIASDYPSKHIAYNEGSEPSQWRPITLTGEEWLSGFSDIKRQRWIEQVKGFRLPMNNYDSEAGAFNEFYLAAAWNGTNNTSFGFGCDILSPADANYRGYSGPFAGSTTPVGYYNGDDHGGTFQTNPNRNQHNIFDLSGNVWEWANDTTGNMTYRVVFGGSFEGDPESLRTSYRGSINPHNTCGNVGIRLVSGLLEE